LKAELCDQKKEKKEGNEMPILTEVEKEYRNKFDILYDRLKKEGLRIPSNLIVVGTVNMDETTHQFSRKVIDRAMTIEMNIADGSKPFADFFDNDADLKYRDEPLDKDLFVSKVVQAKEALELLAKENAEDVAYLKANIPALLSNLNEALNGTPFKIAYRVQNELVIYFFELRRENKETKPEDLLGQAMDAILMQKVLPRVEGDEDLLEKPLEKLHTFTQNYENAHAKVEEMQTRLNAHFTSFWP
jgi:5-methylcytosine-specific restriction endonuclease McrBC GTP-binding regulatory subunit McrB